MVQWFGVDDIYKIIRELDERIKSQVGNIRSNIVILIGKDDVGKSVIASNFAVALASRDGRVL